MSSGSPLLAPTLKKSREQKSLIFCESLSPLGEMGVLPYVSFI